MIILVALVSFLLGFYLHILILPCILSHVVKDVWAYVKNISSTSIFRWSVSLIVSFSISALIIQKQQMRMQKQTEQHYQCIIDSLNLDLKRIQLNKVK